MFKVVSNLGLPKKTIYMIVINLKQSIHYTISNYSKTLLTFLHNHCLNFSTYYHMIVLICSQYSFPPSSAAIQCMFFQFIITLNKKELPKN